MLNKSNLKDIYSLTPLQEGMLFHSQLNAGSSAYTEQTDILIEGIFQPEIFKKSWLLITQKYDAFRSIFITKKADKPLQVIMKELEFDFRIENISQMSAAEKGFHLNQFREKDIKLGFDLSKGPLFRLTIFELGANQYQVIWTFHHIILDGWSLGIILNDLFAFYKDLLNKRAIDREDAPLYNQYIQWLANCDKLAGLKYWKNYLSTIEKQTKIPQKISEQHNGFKLSKIIKKLTINDTDKLKKLAKENGLTLNTVVQTIWAACLNRWCGEDTIVFGTTVSGRQADIKNIENMVGLFINTIPVKFNFQEDKSFLELATQFQKSFTESEKNSYCSLAQIQNESLLKSDLINHLMVFENYPLDEMQTKLSELGFQIKEIGGFEHTNYDFEVVVIPQHQLHLEFKFNENKYDQDLVEDLFLHFEFLCTQVTDKPNSDFNQLNSLKIEIQKKLINEVNQSWDLTKAQFSKDFTVVDMFELQASKYPQKTAVITNNKKISYGELSRLSNIIAQNLINQYKLQKGQFVCLMAGRDEFAIALFLGILKAGGAYVPIDPLYPKDKAEFMLKDSGAPLFIVADEFKDRGYPDYHGKTILISEIINGSATFPKPAIDQKSCAYIIYTSGSTGLPKGCMISHFNLSSLIRDAVVAYDFNEKDIWITSHSFCFDFSIWEIYGALCYGGSLVLPSLEDVKDTSKFLAILSEFQVTVLNQTPPSFYRLIEEDSQSKTENLLKSLRYVIFGGDRLDMFPLQSWVKKYPLEQTVLVNMYGITETTVHVTYKKLYAEDIFNNTGQSPIGTAIPEYSVILLDNKKRITPYGVVGEIYVGGTGVSLGYLNREELTAARFIQNPFNSNERLYRSGDIAIREKNGALLYLGRNDDQIQLRGFRVELGEISHRLENYPLVKEAFVLAIKDGHRDDRLVGFYTLKGEIEPTQNELENWLGATLAEYMIPKQIYKIQKFPLTNNGKIDREELRKIESSLVNNTINESFVEPQTELEKNMAKIWCQILEVEKVGIRSNFFELGGHSIKATQLASSMNKNLNLNFSLKEIFESPTIEKLAYYAQFKKPSVYAKINICKKQEYYELSHAQRRLWIIDKVNGPSSAYHIQGSYELLGNLNVSQLELAFKHILNRHEALRTNFIEIEDKPFQIIRENVAFNIIKRKLNNLELVKQDILNENNKTFDLENDLLIKAYLYEISPTHFVISVCIHHIIADGWSIGVLLNELSALYQGKTLEPLAIQYKDFTYWQNDAIHHSSSMNSQRDFWHAQLEGTLPALDLPTDFHRPEKRNDEGSSSHFVIPSEVTKELKSYLESNQHSLFMGLFAFYNILLHKYSHQNEIVVGVPVSGRYHHDLNNQIGFYLNTLPLRTQVNSQKSVEAFLKTIDENIKNAFDNQVYPFDLLLEKSNKGRGADRVGLYDVMFTLQNFDEGTLAFNNMEAKNLEIDLPNSKFEMTMICKELKDSIGVSIEYSTQLFSKQSIEVFSRHFVQLIKNFLLTKNRSISDLSLMDSVEFKKVTQDFNQKLPIQNTDNVQGVIPYFYEMVSLYPHDIAMVFEEKKLTYQQLDERSNQIANYLIDEIKLKKEEIVGVFFNKGFEMIASIFGILKAGCAYMPVDSNNPDSRIHFFFTDSNCKIVLTEESLQKNIQKLHPNVKSSSQIQGSTSRPQITCHANDLAYLLYTSGSTGVPKGAMIEHGSIVALIKNRNFAKIKRGDRFMQFSNFAFDISIYDIFGTLLNGAALYIVNSDEMSLPETISAFIKKNQINITMIPTALFNVLIDYQPEMMHQFDTLAFGGQEASTRHVQIAWKHRKNNNSIVNIYGPTETTTFSAYYIVENELDSNQSVPIGIPSCQDEIYILDEKLNPVPVGIIGEIYISGLGVAIGYKNRPELNEKSFLKNPFGGKKPLYKTNDLGRWSPDGNIFYHGRNDDQIKIRGYRVEMGDVKLAIANFKGITQVHLTVYTKDLSANKELVGYFVADGIVSIKELREFLLKIIPSYMIPSFLIQVDKLPVNNNGKVDSNLLPKPGENESVNLNVNKPKSELEKVLYGVWSTLLGRKNFSIDDNYFSLGGDSIKAIQMIAALREKKYKLIIKDLYKMPTIAELANVLVPLQQEIKQEKITGEVPLGAIQEWLFASKGSDLHHFNQDLLLEIPSTLEKSKITEAIVLLFSHHDMLRTLYRIDGKKVTQSIQNQVNFALEEVSIGSESEIGVTTTAFNKMMRIDSGSLLRGLLIKTSRQNYLYLNIHHLVIDGFSWRIIIEDLQNCLLAFQSNKKVVLPRKSISFKQWTETLKITDIFNNEINFWKSSLQEISGQWVTNSKLPLQISELNTSLDADFTQKLLGDVHKAFNTQINDILLYALAKTLSSLHGNDNSQIYLEGHGREGLFDDLDISRTIGWFTSLYPVNLKYRSELSTADQIKHFKESLRKIPHNGLGYGVLKYLKKVPELELAPSPIASFNYLGQFEDGETKSDLKISSHKTGQTIATHLLLTTGLELNCYIRNSKLEISLTYSNQKITPDIAEKLMQDYIQNLKAVIDFCLQTEEGGITPSDIDFDEFDIDTLDNVLENL